MKEMQIIKREGLICKVEGEVSLGQSNLAKWEMRCSSWPIGVCHVRGEVESINEEECGMWRGVKEIGIFGNWKSFSLGKK